MRRNSHVFSTTVLTGLRFLLVGAALMLAGCGGKTSSPDEPAAKSRNAKSTKKKHGPHSETPPPSFPARQTPDEAVLAVLHGLRDKRPAALWEFLPAGYQQDVNDAAHRFAARMDAELWKRTFAVGRRIVRLARQRKSEILTPQFVKRAGLSDVDTASKRYDGLLALVEILLDSEFSDLERLKQFDGGQFLTETGGKLIAQLITLSSLLPGDDLQESLTELDQVAARTLSVTGDTAVVELTLKNLPDAEPKTLPFVRVEGKWIPQGLADGWKPNYVRFRKDLEAKLAPELLKQNKQRMLQILTDVDRSLNDLDAAKSPAAFQKPFAESSISGVLLGMLRMTSRSPHGIADPVIPANKQPPKGKRLVVTVIVQGALADKGAEAVADQLFNLGGALDIGDYRIVNGTTRFPVSRVKDFAAFRKSIRFADVVSADESKREIVLKLRTP